MTITFELYIGESDGVSSPSQRPNTAYLKANNWDDYWPKYEDVMR